MSEELEKYQKVSEITGYEPNQVAVIANQIAKGANQFELAYFLNVCKDMDLSPFKKEIWAYKDGKGNLIIFAGRDGLLSKAQKNPLFNGLRSSEVRTNDHINIDIPNGKIDHTFKPGKERGEIIGAYCIVFRKGGEPLVEWVDFDAYNKGYSTWKSDPVAMIKKVAESHALKKAFGLSGVQIDTDWDIADDGTARPGDHVDKDWERISYAGDLLRTSSHDHDTQDILSIKIHNASIAELEEIITNLKDCQSENVNPSMTEIKDKVEEAVIDEKK